MSDRALTDQAMVVIGQPLVCYLTTEQHFVYINRYINIRFSNKFLSV